MKLGLLISYAKEELELAARLGFESVELQIAIGSELDPAVGSQDRIKAAFDEIRGRGLEISAIGHYRNNLDPDLETRRRNVEHLGRLLGLCETAGVGVLCTFAGRMPDKDIPDNIPAFKEVFGPLAKKAEDKGLKIAFENCPMFHYFPFRGVNIAYTPRAWELMFDAVPSEVLGLEYDPSHLICLRIDYLWVVREYGDRIHHVHAKDAEEVDYNVRRNGILEPGAFRHRMPGLGDVNWAKLIPMLVEYGYKGNLDIEGRHDPVYQGETEEAGLVLAKRHLEPLVI